jgi:hypothetical protein
MLLSRGNFQSRCRRRKCEQRCNPDYALPDYPLSENSRSESSSSKAANPASFPLPRTSKEDPGEDREVSLRKLPMNFLHNQKDMWMFPLDLAKGHHWLPASFITGGTAVFMVVMKAIARRQRPTELPVAGPNNDTFFHSNASFFGKGKSFPSDHALMAFSVATVFARRYREHRWVPYLAYAAASAIAFSRVTTGSHFPADVFVGSALGFVIARYDVLHGQ